MKVSVCMATYNGERHIYDQLHSIIKQIGDDDEIIISDDSSTDNTIGIIQSFNDKRIKLHLNQKFKSPIYNFENALRQATGEIMFLSDQDDIWDDTKVAKMLDALKHADMVISDCSIIDDGGNIIVPSYFEMAKSETGLVKNLKKNGYLGCCMAFKSCILKKALPFPPNIPMHDIWLGFVSELFFKPIFLKERLSFYRKHDSNVSYTANGISQYNLLTKINFRLNIIKHLPKLIFR